MENTLKKIVEKIRQEATRPYKIPVFPYQWIGPVLILIVIIGLTAWSWRKWPDLCVDFGLELYVPWQLVSGQVLYKDIAHLFGPFSQYLNSFWFRIFGVSLTTLIFCNLGILLVLVYFIYKIFLIACDRVTATVVCLFLLCIFSFSQYVGVGNYNYVCPYAHESTHGVVLSVAMIFFLSYFIIKRSYIMNALAGICLGLIFMTKAEISFAATVTALFTMILIRFLPDRNKQYFKKTFLLFWGAALFPVIVVFMFFCIHLPVLQALRAVCGAWVSLLSGKVAEGYFFKLGMGLDNPKGNFLLMLKMSGQIILFILIATIANIASRRLKQNRLIMCIIAAVICFLVFFLNPGMIAWGYVGRLLPVLNILILGIVIIMFIKNRFNKEIINKTVPLVIWSVFSFLMLGKMILNARFCHYGFYLAMPSALLLVACLVYLLPKMLSEKLGRGDLFRYLSLALIAVTIVFHLRASQTFYKSKRFIVGRDEDAIATFLPDNDIRGMAISYTLERIEAIMPQDANFVVIPEGTILNYMSRRKNPIPYLNFQMTTMDVFGENNIFNSFKNNPPDFIILVHADPHEFGVKYFGAEDRYGKQIMDWVNKNYKNVEIILNEPFNERNYFGIKIMTLL